MDRARGSVEKEQEDQGLFSFLPKIAVLSRTSLELLQDVLVLSRVMWNLSGGKNFLKRQRVCICTGVHPYGCASLWVCSLHECATLPGKPLCLMDGNNCNPSCVGLDKC